MIIGVPKEVKDHEARVALVPSGVRALTDHGHQVLVQVDAGRGSTISNEEYVAAGAGCLTVLGEVGGRNR